MIANEDDLAVQVTALLRDADLRADGSAAAADFIAARTDMLDGFATRLITELDLSA
jgi:hypothetical protein